MNVFHLNKDLAIIKLSRFELEILINSLQQVFIKIGTREFSTRLAVSYEHAQAFLGRMLKLDRKMFSQNLRRISIDLNYDDTIS